MILDEDIEFTSFLSSGNVNVIYSSSDSVKVVDA